MSKVGRQMLRIVSFAVTVNRGVKDLVKPTRQLLLGQRREFLLGRDQI